MIRSILAFFICFCLTSAISQQESVHPNKVYTSKGTAKQKKSTTKRKLDKTVRTEKTVR